jgi:hypothetical protein
MLDCPFSRHESAVVFQGIGLLDEGIDVLLTTLLGEAL